ncbi:MAG TPA: N-acyl homoserine lactonase family protein [Candidatus Limnocylindria bacterium]|jgi:glyoxylase-like metal-dependent hydrolase (beta-lactamase superfamily II)
MTPADVVPLHLADVTYPASHPLAGQDGPVLAFAIRHPGGLVLVDTGIGAGNEWIEESYRPRSRDVREALSAAKLDAASVFAIVNTHLHFDHCGQNRAFAGVPIHVQRRELELARTPDHTVREWVDFPGARYETSDGDREIVDGVSVLATPGHTEGHQSVVIRAGDGLVLIVGQAAQDARTFAAGPADASVRRLRDLNADRIHFSHDRAVLRRRK